MYLAYTTYSKVVGLIKLPLDGSPHKSVGLIAHPGEVYHLREVGLIVKITNISISYDGRSIFTSGGNDLSVNMWIVDSNAFESTVTSGGEGIQSYIQMIEGGDKGQFWSEIKDYFYYAQIKSQGEYSLNSFQIQNKVEPFSM